MDRTSKQFDGELAGLRTGFLAMGTLVERQFNNALLAIETGDQSLVEAVLMQERLVNDKQLELEKLGLELIAKRQPAAVDLRQIMCTHSAVNDLERIGDEITKIARRSQQLQVSEKFQALRLNELKHLGMLAQAMLSASLKSFANSDVIAAAEIIAKDVVVDREFDRVMRLLETYMVEDTRTITAGLDVAFLAKAIERVADHAKNISEYTIYIVQGYDPRHASL
jgi:phosphate transport system protein